MHSMSSPFGAAVVNREPGSMPGGTVTEMRGTTHMGTHARLDWGCTRIARAPDFLTPCAPRIGVVDLPAGYVCVRAHSPCHQAPPSLCSPLCNEPSTASAAKPAHGARLTLPSPRAPPFGGVADGVAFVFACLCVACPVIFVRLCECAYPRFGGG